MGGECFIGCRGTFEEEGLLLFTDGVLVVLVVVIVVLVVRLTELVATGAARELSRFLDTASTAKATNKRILGLAITERNVSRIKEQEDRGHR